MARIDLVDLAHSYAGNSADPESFALKPISMTWRQGGAYALLGPSGCGKTTTLRSIAGLERPVGGEIAVDGRCVFSSARGTRDFGSKMLGRVRVSTAVARPGL